jgi:hypothetical protein
MKGLISTAPKAQFKPRLKEIKTLWGKRVHYEDAKFMTYNTV